MSKEWRSDDPPEEPSEEWLDQLAQIPPEEARGALSEKAKEAERVTGTRAAERARKRREKRDEILYWVALIFITALLLTAIWMNRHGR